LQDKIWREKSSFQTINMKTKPFYGSQTSGRWCWL